MQPIVEQLDNTDIRNLGAYFASLTPTTGKQPDDNPDLSKKGAQAAAGRRCASCHTHISDMATPLAASGGVTDMAQVCGDFRFSCCNPRASQPAPINCVPY